MVGFVTGYTQAGLREEMLVREEERDGEKLYQDKRAFSPHMRLGLWRG